MAAQAPSVCGANVARQTYEMLSQHSGIFTGIDLAYRSFLRRWMSRESPNTSSGTLPAPNRAGMRKYARVRWQKKHQPSLRKYAIGNLKHWTPRIYAVAMIQCRKCKSSRIFIRVKRHGLIESIARLFGKGPWICGHCDCRRLGPSRDNGSLQIR